MKGRNAVRRSIRSRSSCQVVAVALAASFVAAGRPAPAHAADATPPVQHQAIPRLDGNAYPVAGFRLEYAKEHPRHPDLEPLLDLEITLGQVEDGYVEPRDGLPSARVTLRAARYTKYYASAIRTIDQQIVEQFNKKGLIGVLVQPLETEIEPGSGKDLREPGRVNLHLVVHTGRVEEVRTFAAGDRFEADKRLNTPQLSGIAERSPAQPQGGQDLMVREDLEAYTARLNRHPGRRVDIEVSPALEAGSVYLDYMVAEYKPWYAYAQGSNTGTDGTTDTRERVGFVHTQLTNHDDILRLDYVTGDFDQIHATVFDYEAPVFGMDFDGRLRWRAFGNWSKYESTILGFGEISGDRFKGKSWNAGLHVIANIFQHDELFVDLIAGARWMYVKANNQLLGQEGKDDFFVPRAGLLLERRTDTSYVRLNVSYERSVANVAGTSTRQVNFMGRVNADRNYDVVRADGEVSFYLEPLLFGRHFDDPSTWYTSTLAHEMSITFRGQQSLGNRLIPNEVMTAGGLYSVRGYPEAATFGDNVYLASAEYRLHIPRLLRPRSTEARNLPVLGEFRGRPQYVYGRPDWDLILRLFGDFGRTKNIDREPGEFNSTLWSAGAGLELLLKRNLSLRFDAAQALSPVRGSTNKIRDNTREYRWVVTLLY